jgi:hypothetical protein
MKTSRSSHHAAISDPSFSFAHEPKALPDQADGSTAVLRRRPARYQSLAQASLLALFALALPRSMPAQNATAPTAASSPPAPATPVKPQLSNSVILLPPVVTAEVLSRGGQTGGVAGSLLGTADYGSRNRSRIPPPGSFEALLTDAAKTRLGARGYTLLTADGVQDASAADWLGQLEPMTSRLAHGAINDEARGILSHFATLPDAGFIFVQFMELQQGPGGSWNPNTGGITSAMASTLVRAALISTRTGEVVWKGEVFERKLYRPADAKFAKILDQLYLTLGNGRGNP